MEGLNLVSGGGGAVFAPTGRLTGDDGEALLAAMPPSGSSLALDLTSLAGIDGGGMMALFRVAYLCRSKNIALSAAACPVLSRIFRDSRLTELIRLRQSEALVPFADNEWAEDFGPVHPSELPEGAGPNVLGRRATGPAEGFGELWLKRYTAVCPDPFTEPREAARMMRERLGSAWPPGNSLLFGQGGIRPGAVGAIALAMPGRGRLHTGVRVVHADALSYTLATLEGHMASGWINFSTARESGLTAIRIESLARTSDPVFDAGFRLFGHRSQEEFWRATLERIVGELRQRVTVTSEKTLIDGNLRLGGVFGLATNAILPSMAAEALKRFFPGKAS